ncbi:MAG: HAMP domain-containing histidine kinase, partial [Anaerolineae bacterium]|nr:HAMP domain-containing histidine kinase [Anaerolineae bacterium]
AEDISWGEAFASQAAIALVNARLYHQLSQFNDQLEQMVDERTEELNRAYSILEKLDQTKSDFIHISAHELRTPLTIIKGYTQVLKLNPTLNEDDNAHEMMAGILSGVDRLHQIVNSMLDVTKIASGSLDVYKEKCQLADILSTIQQRYAPDLVERQLTLTITKNIESLPPLDGDLDLLTKTFQALIVNAIKYTPDGGMIAIDGQVISAAEKMFIEVKVQDSGIGIEPKHHSLIFEKFYQTGELALHSSGHTSFKGGGPGLGLAIAKGIIEAHGGRIWVESSGYDEAALPGSCFYVRLPLFPQS